MVRLKDIALRAGVSVMTVSKVLRNAPDISPATKSRVRQLAETMGYVPDSMAQGLRSRKTHLFGLLISATTNPIFARTVMAIEDRSFESGYDLLLAHSLNQPEREEMILRRFLSRRVDGIFVAPTYRLEPKTLIYRELLERKIPVVILGHKPRNCEGHVNVQGDDLTGSAIITRHFIELGHRNIAFFTGSMDNPSSVDRFEGYKRALREANLSVNDQLVFHAGGTMEDGVKAALQLLDEHPKVTAIQAVNDLVAIGAANTFLQQGIHIPRDLSVAGYGNILTSEHFRVPLTTIRQPKFRLGSAAMDMMLKMIKGETPDSIRLSGEIAIRQSTAPPTTSDHTPTNF